ncbi:hypothetical protein PHJA_002491100 [Phtheirospermum japonicum]|uniref:B box-type domain-containing protein n=1 Tax=Phtheirospermum japonicum TaxID=374723 RepID=A0A830CYV3_9LAMI|nr:hypothetical protein PHJA_002491100 [Phtheirospermum japonicum]
MKNLPGGEEEEDGNTGKWAPWVGPLLQTSFFGQCRVHVAAAHKGECNMFCLDCINGPLCSLCLNSHKASSSRYTGVQTYIINSAKIVFLNQRPQQPRPRPRGSATPATCVIAASLTPSISAPWLQAGTSKDFHKEKIIRTDIIGGSDSDESIYSQHSKNRSKTQSFTPSTPPRTAMMNFRSPKRRKGVPHRAPTGAIFIEC